MNSRLANNHLNNAMNLNNIKTFFKLLKRTGKKWMARGPFREGPIIAYYAIFALPGLLVVSISIAGYIFGNEVVTGELHAQISDAIGESTADSVQALLRRSLETEDSTWASILGFATILIGATTVFAQLQQSFNNIWEVEADKQKTGVWPFIKTRLFSFGLILSIGFLLLVFLLLSSLLSAFGNWIQQYFSESILILVKILNICISLGVITLLFALLLKVLPDAKIRWRAVWIGAFMTALLFVLGETALGFYFGTADPGSGYGPASSVVLILLWTSYSAMIVFFGAEFTRVYSDYHYGKREPSDHAQEKKSISTDN
ncbi:ribonuclease BN [Marivirga lumbricoides]|uniref:Ribonuclease BN n=1 Tax=Marivirga lumbricoides TaxID=1046115 RepID=A0A2T4DL07_9BACT|nr:ribonuclease BN [Marivirga lumbricoides]